MSPFQTWEPLPSAPRPTKRLDPNHPQPRTVKRRRPLATVNLSPTGRSRAGASSRGSSLWATLWRGFVLGLLGSVLVALIGVGAGLGVYASYAASLPSPDELYARTATFKSTKIMDRRGRLLYEVFDPTAGRRTLVHIDEVPRHAIQAVVATEDSSFYVHLGVDPASILRALLADLREGEIVQGGSTITQQVVKNLYLSREKTVSRKIKEAILATELTRRYSKDDILEIYLNEVYFGNLAYGLGAASEAYFGKHVSRLTLPEAALLAGIIQSPALYDPYTDPEAALARRATVLRLMRENGYITTAQERDAAATPLSLMPQQIVMEAPHMVTFVREQLEHEVGTQALYAGGLYVYTTLDLELQHRVEKIVQEQVQSLRERGASNAAVVVLDPATGDILAMVGSADFYSREIDGQVNVTRRLRQPGSTIKPLTYLAALERGWTPATMLMDVRQEFPDGANPPYVPVNYDGKEWGPVSLRAALANSRNIPAVSTLHQIGLPALLEMAQRLGIASLDRPDYGLSLALGGGEVTPLELTAAYGALANGGHKVAPRPVLDIVDQEGHVLLDRQQGAKPVAVVDPRHVYLITDILADAEARVPAFGRNSALELPFPAAVKTGTTNDYRDSWAIGYTPDLVVGVWVGNNDNTPMDSVAGSRGAAPIWHDVMIAAREGKPVSSWARPDGLVEVEVCAISGQRPTERCSTRHTEWMLANTALPTCSVHRSVQVCRVTGELATTYCPPDALEERSVEDYGPSWDGWAHAKGLVTPPRATCSLHQHQARVEVRVMQDGQEGVWHVVGTTEVPEFSAYWVEVGRGESPTSWTPLTPHINSAVVEGTLCLLDTTRLKEGRYTLRLTVSDLRGQLYRAETVAHVRTEPRPTATLADGPIATIEPTIIPWPEVTAAITAIASPTSAAATPQPTSHWDPVPSASPTVVPYPEVTGWAPTPQPTPEGRRSDPHRPPMRQ